MPAKPAIPTPADEKRLYLIDGYGFVFRAYHSIRELNAPDGTPVNAVYGFTNMLLKLRQRVRPNNGDYMLVVFDAGRKTFRNEIYSDYKANRPPAPEDLVPQFPLVREAAEAIGLPTATIEGYEADDIIATCALQGKEQGMKVTIVSSDKDLMQLVDDDIHMFDAMKDKDINPKEVEEKFGVMPEKVLDVLALMGDSSDNIPGVPGIGPKTAAELLNQFGNLDEVLAQAETIPQKKRRESLIDFAEQARLSRELASLCKTVPDVPELETLAVRDETPEEILQFLHKLGFKSLITKFEQKHGVQVADIITETKQPAKNTKKQPTEQFEQLEDSNALQRWLEQTPRTGKLALALMQEDAPITGLALSCEEGYAAAIRFNQPKTQPTQSSLFGDDANSPAQTNHHDGIMDVLTPLLQHPSIMKFSCDSKRLMEYFGEMMTPIDDVMVMSYVLDGNKHKHDIETLVEQYDNAEKSTSDEPWYMACRQASALCAIHASLRQRLFNEQMLTVYETIERPLTGVLTRMEMHGIKVDPIVLKTMSDDFAKRLTTLEKEIYTLANKEFNIGSPKQLGSILFEDMGIEGGKKSKKSGNYSTGADVLEALAAQGHIIASKILEWRALSKLKSTYTDALGKEINPKTGRVHTTFGMASTSTGRLSSSAPNLQNIPIRTEEGRKIRCAFVAEKGNKLISADYSQIELRLLAHMAKIAALKDAFIHGEDIHTKTASQVFDIPIEKIDSMTRRKAKAINFGIIYGQSAFGLANQLDIDRSTAKAYIDAYFEQYPGIRHYMETTKEFAHKHEYVETLFGRKCYLHSINSKGPQRAFAERAAINAPLQGTAADIIKKAMIQIDRWLDKEFPQAKMILQVHDELLFEVPEAQADTIAKRVKHSMEQVINLSVPLTVEANPGNHWGEIH